MLGQYARQQEEWIPVSDWGREQKRRNEEYLRELAIQNKPAATRLATKPSRKVETLEDMRAKYREKYRRRRERLAANKVERKCQRCSSNLYSTNKIGICTACRTPEDVNAFYRTERRTCSADGCENKLNSHNKTGLCDKHSKRLRMKAYLERKRAA